MAESLQLQVLWAEEKRDVWRLKYEVGMKYISASVNINRNNMQQAQGKTK
jgi:hypothetical protein